MSGRNTTNSSTFMATLWSENVPRHCKQFYEHVEVARVVVPACRDFISGEERDPVEIRDTHEIWVDGWASMGGVGNTRPGIGPSEPQPAPSRLNAPRGLGRRRGGVGRGERTRQQKMGAQRLCERRARRRERAERGEEREVHVMPADGNGETAGGRVVAAVWDGFVSGRGPRAWRGRRNLFCYDEGRPRRARVGSCEHGHCSLRLRLRETTTGNRETIGRSDGKLKVQPTALTRPRREQGGGDGRSQIVIWAASGSLGDGD